MIVCPHCGSDKLYRDYDGDLMCLPCGKIVEDMGSPVHSLHMPDIKHNPDTGCTLGGKCLTCRFPKDCIYTYDTHYKEGQDKVKILVEELKNGR